MLVERHLHYENYTIWDWNYCISSFYVYHIGFVSACKHLYVKSIKLRRVKWRERFPSSQYIVQIEDSGKNVER